MKKFTIALFVLFSLSTTGSALANGSSKPIPPKTDGFVAQSEQGPWTSVFSYFNKFFG